MIVEAVDTTATTTTTDEHDADRLADEIDHQQRHLANDQPGVTATGKVNVKGQSEQPYGGCTDGPCHRPIPDRHPCTWRPATCQPPAALVGKALPRGPAGELGIAPCRHLKRSLRVPESRPRTEQHEPHQCTGGVAGPRPFLPSPPG